MNQDDQQSSCTKCGVSPATNYVCYGGTGKSVQYCDNCLPTEDPLTANFVAEAKNATCDYCGGAPCSGSLDSLNQILGRATTNRWMCMPCSMEYHPFLLKKLEGFPEDLSQAEQMELLQEASEETDTHMKAFVRQRDN